MYILSSSEKLCYCYTKEKKRKQTNEKPVTTTKIPVGRMMLKMSPLAEAKLDNQ